jgi:hypothetical protein
MFDQRAMHSTWYHFYKYFGAKDLFFHNPGVSASLNKQIAADVLPQSFAWSWEYMMPSCPARARAVYGYQLCVR